MRILLIKTHRLGDVLQALPLLRALRLRWPTAEIEFLVMAKYAVLLECNTDATTVIGWRQSPTDPDVAEGLAVECCTGDEALLRRLCRDRYDLVINLNPDAYTSTLAMGVPTHQRIGCFQGGSGLVRMGSLALWQASAILFRPLSVLNFADGFCQSVGLLAPEWGSFPGEPEPLFQKLGLDVQKPTVAIQPGSADAYRRWPAARYAAVASAFRDRGVQVAVLGSAAESEMAAAICEPSGAHFAAGLDLRELRGFLKGCQLLLTNDTGPMHLAASLQIPTLSLFFGPSVPQDTGAFLAGSRTLVARLPCVPCAQPSACTLDLACRDTLSPEAVLALADGTPLPAGIQGYQAEKQAGLLFQRPLTPLSVEEWSRFWFARAWLRVWGPSLPLPPRPEGDLRPFVSAASAVQAAFAQGKAPPELPGSLGVASKLAQVLPALLRMCPEEKRSAPQILRRLAEEMGKA